MEKFLYLINQVLDVQQQIPDEVLQEVNTLQEQRILGSFNTTEDPYEELLQNWMYQWTDVQIIGTIPVRPEWKFRKNIRIYEGLDSEGWRCVVFLSILHGEIRYEKVLRAMRDPFIVKETFEEEELTYRYYQFTLVDSPSAVETLFTQLNRPNPRNWFRNTNVQCNIGYINEDGDLFVADGNHPMG